MFHDDDDDDELPSHGHVLPPPELPGCAQRDQQLSLRYSDHVKTEKPAAVSGASFLLMSARTFSLNLLTAYNVSTKRFSLRLVTPKTRVSNNSVHTFLEGGTPAPKSEQKNFEEPEIHTVEKLVSGRSVRVFDPTLRPATRRTLADLTEEEVKPLIEKYISEKSMVKLGRRGVTDQVGHDILKRWNTRECVKVHADHKSVKGNMKVTGERLEELTGGIVIWKSGSRLLLYRDDVGRKMRDEEKKKASPPRMPYDPYDDNE